MGSKSKQKNDDTTGQKAGKAFEQSNESFQALFGNLIEGVQILDRDWCYLYLNPTAERHNRRPNQELLGQQYMEMWPGIEETHVFSLIKCCMEERVASQLENRFVFPDGTEGWFVLSIQPIPEGVFLLSFEITERIHAEKQVAQMKRLYATLSQVNQTIVRVKEPGDLYQSICDVSVKFGEFSLAWVGLLDEASGDIRPVAANGLDVEQWPFPIANLYKDEFSNGLAASAIRSSRVVTSEDLQAHERIKSQLNLLQGYNYHSSAVVPFRLGGKTIGCLNLVSQEAGLFKDKEEISLLEEMGLDISFALDKIEIEKAKHLWANAFEHCAHGLVIGDPYTNQIRACNLAFAREQGGTVEEFISMPLVELYPPEDREQIKQYIAHSDRTGSVRFEANKVRKDGSVYAVQMDLVSVRDERGNLLYRVATQQNITERKRAEEQRNVLAERLDLATRSARIGIWDWDIVKNDLIWDERMYALYGLKPGEFGGAYEAWLHGVHPEDRANTDDAVTQAVLGKQEYDIEFRVLWPDGSVRWMKANGQVFRSEQGTPLRMIGVNYDITERKQAEDTLRKNEEFLSLVYKNSDIGIFVVNVSEEGKYLYEGINPVHEKLLGVSNAQIAGKTPDDLVSQFGTESVQYIKSMYAACVQSRDTIESEFYVPHGSAQGWWYSRLTPLIDESTGRVTRLMGSGILITERKQAEEALQEVQSILSTAEEVAQIGSWKWDLRTQKVAWSDQMFRLFGVERDGFDGDINRIVTERIHPDDRAQVEASNRSVLEKTHPIPLSYRILHPDGTQRTVWAQGKLIQDETGQPVALTGYIQDITERTRAEEKLLASERTLKLFVEYAPASIAMFDRDMKYIAASRRYIIDYRLPDEKIVGRSHYEIFPEIPERWKVIHRRCLAGAIENAEEDPFPRMDGTLDWVRWEIHPWYEESGEIGGIILFSEVITERIRTKHEIQQRNEDLQIINALNEAVNRGEDIHSIVDVFARETRNTFHCKSVATYLLSPDAKYVEMQTAILPQEMTENIEKLIGQPIPKIQIPLRGDSYFNYILGNSQGILTSDPVVLQKWIEEFSETTFLPSMLRPAIKKMIPLIYRALNIGCTFAIPLVSSGRTIGIMDIASAGQFTEEDLRRIRAISSHLTAVLMRKQAEERIQLQLRRLSALSYIDRAISSSLDMRVSIEVLLSEVLSQLDVDAAAVLLLNETTLTLEYFAGKGFRTLAIRQARMRLGEGLAGQVGLERKLLHVSDLAGNGPQLIRKDLVQSEGFVEYFGIPLVAKGMLKGVLETFQRTPVNPELEWVNYLETLGGQAAIAIDNAHLFESMQKSNMEMFAAYDATIAGWSHAMDLRDKETEGHSQRVTELTLKLAEQIGISNQERVYIRHGALLHDIGKLGIPDQILLKPGKLTEQEWALMRQHPTYALEMLMPISYLRPALDIPYCHHERWDGSGYPRGLHGEQIPLAARIFAVVDVWDALTSDRPYRAAWSIEETLLYIQEQAGHQFDPKVVDIFLRVIGMDRTMPRKGSTLPSEDIT